MLKIKVLLKLIILLILIQPLSSCKKPAGPGGKATIKGKVIATDWDNSVRYVLSRGPAVDMRVYIVYGKDNNFAGDDVRTGPDGTYSFNYLNKGHYKVYVNSLDTTINQKGNDTYISVIKEFDIKGADETKTLEDFHVNR